MGISLTRARVRLSGTKDAVDGMQITTTGTGHDESDKDPDIYTLEDLAQGVCVQPEDLLEDLLRVTRNRHVVKNLWDEHASSFIKELEAEHKETFDDLAPCLEENNVDECPWGPDDYLYGVLRAIYHGAKWKEWTVDISVGIFVTINFNRSEWQQCRRAGSVMVSRKDDVEAYQKAIKDLHPFLLQLEGYIADYEAATELWKAPKNRKEEHYLGGVGIINAVVQILDVYEEQLTHGKTKPTDDNGDARMRTETMLALAREMAERCAEQVAEDLSVITLKHVRNMRELYFDQDFNKAIHEFLKLWDPTNHYYFHAVASQTVGIRDFDNRFFKAVVTLAGYLASDETSAEMIAEEAESNLDAVWNAVLADIEYFEGDPKQRRRSAAFVDHATTLEKGSKLYEALNHTVGVLSNFAVAAGFCSMIVGNFEGPPSIFSLFMNKFSEGKRFIEWVSPNTLVKGSFIATVKRSAVFFGMSKDMRKTTIDQLKTLTSKYQGVSAGARAQAHDAAVALYQNSHWRSGGIYSAFYLLSYGVLIYDVMDMLKKLGKDADHGKFEQELIKKVGVIAQDILGIKLLALTSKHTQMVRTYMISNPKATGAELRAAITSADDAIRPAVRLCHRAMAGIGLVLNLWNTIDNWNRSDTYEKTINGLAIGGSALSLIGTFIAGSALGPIGFGIAVAAAIASYAYENYFVAGIENTLKELLLGFKQSKFCQKHKYLVVDKSQFIEKLGDKTSTKYDTIVNAANELKDMVDTTDWHKLDTEYAIHYLRTGIKKEQVMTLYGWKPEKREHRDLFKKAIDENRDTQRKQRKIAYKQTPISINLIAPAQETTPLVIGASNRVKIALFNHSENKKIDYIWLGWAGNANAADKYLNGPAYASAEPTSYDSDKKAVILKRVARTNRTVYYEGTFRVCEMPASVQTDDGRPATALTVYIPKHIPPKDWEYGNMPRVMAQRSIRFPLEWS